MTTEGNSSLRDPLLPHSPITVSHIYKIRPEALIELFEERNLRSSDEGEPSRSLQLLRKQGFVEGILKKLATEKETGIIGDERDIKRRKQFFGKNKKPLPQLPTILDSIKEALDNRILLALGIAAFFSTITGMLGKEGPAWGWVEGASIFFAIFLLVTIQAVNDWIKDKQFVKLQSLVKNEDIAVIRGKYGATQSVNVYKLVVGDILLLETGSRVPADCLLIEGQDVTVDESFYTKDISKAVKKEPITEDNQNSNPDPFLLSQSLVTTGSGLAVVCCVGKNSRRGTHEEKLDTESKTPLQVKLDNLGGTFTKWGIYASIAILLANLTNLMISALFYEKISLVSLDTFDALVKYVVLSITIIIVAVPEGLPLTIAISLAFSVMRMKDDQILVKNLNAPEVMGSVEEICTGKTATLTKNDMKVAQFYAQTLLIRNTRKNTLLNCELESHMIDLIKESILFNCEARIEMDDKAYYVPVGNGTEVGLIKFLQEAEIPVHDIIKQKLGRIEVVVPFSTIRKRSIVAVRHPDMEDIVRIYVKGASEYILPKCVRTFGVDGNKQPMSDDQLNYINNNIISKEFTTKGYRALAFAYKDLNYDEFLSLKQECNNFQEEQDREALESQLTFVGVFALQDDLRDKVLRSVQYAQKGHITIRMVSGDNLETATAVAIKAGIISVEESQQRYACMTADEFRKAVGGMRRSYDADGNIRMEITNKKEFQQIQNRLRVLGRAIPYDKHLLVVGLKELGKTVAVTGDGINDVDALRAADVGFAMGSGVSIAKDAADMILTSDNFEATMNAVMWGRNIYANVRRFIQFQVTVNFSALAVVFIGAALLGESPLSSTQLLWINLIMDTFAALALATERPHPSIIKNPPVKKGDQVLTPILWRQIYGMSAYMVIVMTLLMLFGEYMWDINYEKPDPFTDKDGKPTGKSVHYTILFNTFVFMQIFNEINCRKVGAKAFNVFAQILSNWYFIAVVGGTVAMQLVFVEYFGKLMRVTPLTQQQNAACIMWGASTLLVSAILKLTPEQWVKKIPMKIDEDKPMDENDPLMAAYNKQANAKVTKRGSVEQQ